MPHDARNDDIGEDLPKSPPRDEKANLPPREASNGGQPLLESVSIKKFQPSAELSSQIDAALGSQPARQKPPMTGGLASMEANSGGNGQLKQ